MNAVYQSQLGGNHTQENIGAITSKFFVETKYKACAYFSQKVYHEQMYLRGKALQDKKKKESAGSDDEKLAKPTDNLIKEALAKQSILKQSTVQTETEEDDANVIRHLHERGTPRATLNVMFTPDQVTQALAETMADTSGNSVTEPTTSAEPSPAQGNGRSPARRSVIRPNSAVRPASAAGRSSVLRGSWGGRRSHSTDRSSIRLRRNGSVEMKEPPRLATDILKRQQQRRPPSRSRSSIVEQPDNKRGSDRDLPAESRSGGRNLPNRSRSMADPYERRKPAEKPTDGSAPKRMPRRGRSMIEEPAAGGRANAAEQTAAPRGGRNPRRTSSLPRRSDSLPRRSDSLPRRSEHAKPTTTEDKNDNSLPRKPGHAKPDDKNENTTENGGGVVGRGGEQRLPPKRGSTRGRSVGARRGVRRTSSAIDSGGLGRLRDALGNNNNNNSNNKITANESGKGKQQSTIGNIKRKSSGKQKPSASNDGIDDLMSDTELMPENEKDNAEVPVKTRLSRNEKESQRSKNVGGTDKELQRSKNMTRNEKELQTSKNLNRANQRSKTFKEGQRSKNLNRSGSNDSLGSQDFSRNGNDSQRSSTLKRKDSNDSLRSQDFSRNGNDSQSSKTLKRHDSNDSLMSKEIKDGGDDDLSSSMNSLSILEFSDSEDEGEEDGGLTKMFQQSLLSKFSSSVHKSEEAKKNRGGLGKLLSSASKSFTGPNPNGSFSSLPSQDVLSHAKESFNDFRQGLTRSFSARSLSDKEVKASTAKQKFSKALNLARGLRLEQEKRKVNDGSDARARRLKSAAVVGNNDGLHINELLEEQKLSTGFDSQQKKSGNTVEDQAAQSRRLLESLKLADGATESNTEAGPKAFSESDEAEKPDNDAPSQGSSSEFGEEKPAAEEHQDGQSNAGAKRQSDASLDFDRSERLEAVRFSFRNSLRTLALNLPGLDQASSHSRAPIPDLDSGSRAASSTSLGVDLPASSDHSRLDDASNHSKTRSDDSAPAVEPESNATSAVCEGSDKDGKPCATNEEKGENNIQRLNVVRLQFKTSLSKLTAGLSNME
mgnify:CR=1 FL=1